jgi:hypothetical protein
VGHLRLAQPLAQAMHEARLPDPRVARDEDRLPEALLRLLETVEQEPKLLLTPHEGREPGRPVETARDPARLDHPVDPDRLGDALERRGAPVLRDEEPRHEPQRRVADHHRVGLGEGLEARGYVQRVAERQRLPLLPAPHLADYHRPGVDPDPDLEPQAVLGLEPGGQDLELAQDLAARPHRALRVILVGLRVAEVDEQTIAQVLGHLALVARDRLRGARVIGLHDPAVGLRVEPLA